MVLPGDPSDATLLDGEAFVAFGTGGVISYPDKQSLPLRPYVAAVEGSRSIFGIGLDFYAYDLAQSASNVTPLPPRLVGSVHTFESARLDRVWVNEDWVLRAFNSIAGSFWEAARRQPQGGVAHVVAYGGLPTCGDPLQGDEALVLDRRVGTTDVVGISLVTRQLAWRVANIPLDDPHCVAASKGTIAVGGALRGRGAVAIWDKRFWHVVELASVDSLVEPQIRDGVVLAAAPGEDYTASNVPGAGVSRAGAVYVIEGNGNNWSIGRRLVAERPKPLGLFGFRVVLANKRLLVNHFGGAEGNDTPVGVPDGPAEICEFVLPTP